MKNSAGDFTNSHLKTTYEERARPEKTWVLALNTEGPTGPMRERPDYAEAARTKNRLRHEAGDEN